jgi:hypothetical protein
MDKYHADPRQSGDGSKGVAVGTRIAVIADPEDDVSTLEIPAEETPKKEAAPEPKASEPSSKTETTAPESKSSSPKPKGKGKEQTRPLYPSVELLLHANHLSASDIPPTGPNNRLLKGDVLAYLEQIPSSAPAAVSSRISKLSHLDLSNIKPAAPKTSPKAAAEAPKPQPEVPVSLTVPVSLSAVLEVQKRMQNSLGITLPLSTFIARAIALANEDLPVTGPRTPTADELFHSIVGLDRVSAGKKFADGKFSPRIMALPDRGGLSIAPKAGKKSDLFDDILGGKKSSVGGIRNTGVFGAVGEANVFSLSVKKEEERRAKVFLERVKSVLEVEPGRLVL